LSAKTTRNAAELLLKTTTERIAPESLGQFCISWHEVFKLEAAFHGLSATAAVTNAKIVTATGRFATAGEYANVASDRSSNSFADPSNAEVGVLV